jgi:hypothetical protein
MYSWYARSNCIEAVARFDLYFSILSRFDIVLTAVHLLFMGLAFSNSAASSSTTRPSRSSARLQDPKSAVLGWFREIRLVALFDHIPFLRARFGHPQFVRQEI